MNRDYKARSGELADVVRLVSTQARQLLFMRRALELKPWADHRDSEIRSLKRQLDFKTTELATAVREKNQLEADKVEKKEYEDRIEKLEIDLLKANAERITPPLPLILPSVPMVGPAGIAALLETHDSLYWYRLAQQHETAVKTGQIQNENATRNHIAQIQMLKEFHAKEIKKLNEKHKELLDAKAKVNFELCAQLKASR